MTHPTRAEALVEIKVRCPDGRGCMVEVSIPIEALQDQDRGRLFELYLKPAFAQVAEYLRPPASRRE